MKKGQVKFLLKAGTCSDILPVNAHAEANILNLNYINSFIFYSSRTRLSNDIHHNQQLRCMLL